MIFERIDNRPITLDITGNEPTFDVSVLQRTLKVIKNYKSMADKIVLTSNGYQLKECLNDLIGSIDILNISVHHYDYLARQNIFRTSDIPDDESIKQITEILKENGITCTAVVVLNKKIENFEEFYNNFAAWARNIGFKDVRIRSNFCSNDEFFDEILNIKMKNEQISAVKGLITKIIIDENTGFKTYILKGVPDLTKYVVGTELIIDDDGLCYIDYNKRYPVNNSNIDYFKSSYILDDFSEKSTDSKEKSGPVLSKKRNESENLQIIN